MPKVGTAYVSIRAKLDKLDDDLKRGQKLTEQRSLAMQKSVSNVFKSVSLFAGGSVAFRFIVKGFEDSINAASNFEESFSKVKTLFGSGETRVIEEWARGAADAMGLSEQAALDAIGTIGNMFMQLGAGVSQTSLLSRELVQLSSDLASFHNAVGGAAAVSAAMQSAFRGEYDALQRYIPTINAAAVQQQALSDTAKSSKDELTDLEKALAAYKIIVRDAGAAVGDFERTSDGYANTTRRLDAAWNDFSATLGDRFLPIITEVKGVTADVLQNLSEAIKGPSIDAQIAQAEREYELLLQKRDAKEEYYSKRRSERELRHQQDVERYIRRNTRVSQESLNALAAFQSKQAQELKMSPDELDIKNAELYLLYLKDIKRLQRLGDTDPSQVSKDIPGDAKKSAKAVKELERQMKALDDAIRESNANPWDPIGYDLDAGDIDEVTAAINRMENARNNEAIAIKRNIELQNRMDKAIDDTYTDYGDYMDGIIDDTDEFTAEMQTAITGWASSFSSQLTDALFDSQATFDGILESFIKMLAQMVIQKKLIEPLLNFNFGGTSANVEHSGGPVGYGPKRTVPSHIFWNAPKLHSGLSSDEFPAILQRGETVIPKGGSTGGVTVNIINNTGAKVNTKERETPNGPQIDVIIDNVVANKAMQRGSALNKALRSGYGANEPLVTR